MAEPIQTIYDRLAEMLKEIRFDGSKKLNKVRRWDKSVGNMPEAQLTFLVGTQMEWDTGRSTQNTWRFILELYFSTANGEDKAWIQYEEFLVQMLEALRENPTLGGAVFRVNLSPRDEPSIIEETNKKYLHVVYQLEPETEEE